eukprot:1160513-Pelagomonas_calceolata.AAC.21
MKLEGGLLLSHSVPMHVTNAQQRDLIPPVDTCTSSLPLYIHEAKQKPSASKNAVSLLWIPGQPGAGEEAGVPLWKR